MTSINVVTREVFIFSVKLVSCMVVCLNVQYGTRNVGFCRVEGALK